MRLLLAFVITGVSAWADSFDIAASERGWVCQPVDADCSDNNGASATNNYAAGSLSVPFTQYRDWFEFSIPTLTGGSLVSATLNLDEPGLPYFGHVGGTLTFAVYGLTAQPLVFTDVTNSNPFGSVSTTSADGGTTVSIPLNAAALAAISADQGTDIFIGGIDSGENTSTGAGDFFSTGLPGVPSNTKLDLTTATVPSPVPEPSSLILLATVIVAVLVGGRRRIRT